MKKNIFKSMAESFSVIKKIKFGKMAALKIGLCAIASLSLITSVTRIGHSANQYTVAEDEYSNLRTLARGGEFNSENRSSLRGAIDNVISAVTGSEGVETISPSTVSGDLINFTALQKVNPDIIAWIRIPGTAMDYPVMKSKNNSEYLKYTPEMNKNIVGSVFMDYRNSSDFSDFHTLIYGHNMKNGSMFRTVANYRDENYYKAHPTVTISTPAGVKTYNIISAFQTDAKEIVYTIDFEDEAEYTLFVAKMKEESQYDTGVVADTSKKMITLSTCVGVNGAHRFVLCLQEK